MHARALLLAYVAFVVYGSLVPFDYVALPLDEAWRSFMALPYLRLGVESRADWIANGVLYLPLGVLAARVLAEAAGRRSAAGDVLALACCTALAVAVEFVQQYFPARTVSLNDLIAEAIGSALGVGLAPRLAEPVVRLRNSWSRSDPQLVRRALEVYAVVYLALSFFPFDVLLSTQELRDKAASGAWGWLFAGDERGPLIAAVQLGVEAALALPLGLLWALWRPRARPRVGAAAVVGALLGLGLETGQFVIASGVTQGASVLARAAGVATGAWIAGHPSAMTADALRRVLRRSAWLAIPAYVVLLVAVNGWFRQRWLGHDAALGAWAQARLLPFYYHYFTTEMAALISLGSVALMYLPIAGVGWAFGWRAAPAVALAGLAALLIEASKLFLDGMHPDATNVLIAAGSTWLVLTAAGSLAKPAPRVAEAPLRATASRGASSWASLGLLAVPAAAVWSGSFPAFAAPLTAILLACAAVVWRWPLAALAIVPASLPMLDLAPWTGRFFVDEFDLVCAVSLAVAFHRSPGRAVERWQPRWMSALFVLLAVSVALSTLRALLPWPALDDNSFSSYFSPFNALRIAKGAAWAAGFVALFTRLEAPAERRARAFEAGMLCGLTFTVLWIVWERAAFAGVFDFAADFRVSGPFSAMHRGGAYIECYVAIGAAFAVAALVRARGRAAGALAALLLLAVYATMVTYSRAGYVALAVAVLAALAAGARPAAAAMPRGARAAIAALALAIALPVLFGGHAGERLARSGSDLSVRAAHWRDALEMRQPGWSHRLLGEGLGRFPERHYWQSREPVHAGTYRLAREDRNRYLRLGAGATLYVEQIVGRIDTAAATVELDARSGGSPGEIGIALCDKWLLTSTDCRTARVVVPAGNAWHRVRVLLAGERDGRRGLPWRPPSTLSLTTPKGDVSVDVDNVSLRAADGTAGVVNGGFDAGLDRWFFTTDVDPPWHVHSLPIGVLFEQGWLGVGAWSMLLAGALVGGAAVLRSGRPIVPAALPALLAFVVCAMLNTLIDQPRFLWLLWVMAWFSTARRPWTRPASDGQ